MTKSEHLNFVMIVITTKWEKLDISYWNPILYIVIKINDARTGDLYVWNLINDSVNVLSSYFVENFLVRKLRIVLVNILPQIDALVLFVRLHYGPVVDARHCDKWQPTSCTIRGYPSMFVLHHSN